MEDHDGLERLSDRHRQVYLMLIKPKPKKFFFAQPVFGKAGGDAPQTTAFLARKSGTTYNSQYKALINGGVADGWFQKLDALYIFATDTSANALLNLVQNAFNGTATGSPTFTAAGAAAGGFTGAAAPGIYIDTGFQPNAQAGSAQFQQNSASGFGWSNTAAVDNSPIWGIGPGGTAGQTHLYPNASGNFNGDANGTGSYPNVADGNSGKGFYAVSRSGTSVALYRNGSSVFSTTETSSVLATSGNLVLLNGDSATGNASARQVMAGGFSSSLSPTDHANLYARLHTFLQSVAGIP